MKNVIRFTVLGLCGLFAHTSFAQSNGAATEEFKPSGSFTGQLFGDYYYMISADTAGLGKTYYEPNANISPKANTRDFQAFDLRRVQLGYNYKFTKDIIAKVLFEHENGAAGNGDVLKSTKRGVYLKEASIAFANAVPMATLILGQQATNVFAVDEGLMGYRSVEKSLLDMRGMSEAGSNDLGIQLVGNFDAEKNFGYSALISNGMGAKDEVDRYKDFTGELNAKLMDKHIVVDVAGDYMPTTDSTSKSLIKVAAAYTSDPITIGAVYAIHTIGVGNSVDAINETGISIFARGQIVPKSLNAFARFDLYDPNSKVSDAGHKENFLTVGLDWMPSETANVHIEPNLWMNMFSDKSAAGVTYEPITVGRVTFFYKY